MGSEKISRIKKLFYCFILLLENHLDCARAIFPCIQPTHFLSMTATPFLTCVVLETQTKVNFLKQTIYFLSCLYFHYITAARVMVQ